jgi:plasmid stability protein
MTNVLIRDVPDDVHGELLRRAEAAGQSLQQYLRSELQRLVSRPTMAEILDRLDREASATIGFDEALAARDEARNGGH